MALSSCSVAQAEVYLLHPGGSAVRAGFRAHSRVQGSEPLSRGLQQWPSEAGEGRKGLGPPLAGDQYSCPWV